MATQFKPIHDTFFCSSKTTISFMHKKTQQKPVFLQTVKDRFSNLMTFKTNGSGITYWLQECSFAEKTSVFLAEVKTDPNYSIS